MTPAPAQLSGNLSLGDSTELTRGTRDERRVTFLERGESDEEKELMHEDKAKSPKGPKGTSERSVKRVCIRSVSTRVSRREAQGRWLSKHKRQP